MPGFRDRGDRRRRHARLLDEREHLRGDVVPRQLGEHGVDLAAPGSVAVGGERQRDLALGDERLPVAGDADAGQLAIVAHHVDDRRRHDRPPGGEIFGRLGRADEARRFVDRERHQRDVPAADIGRQLVIGPAAEIVDVRAPGQFGRIDLHHRADDHDAPVGSRVGDRRQQRQVHPLVDDAVEAEPRAGQRALVGRVRQPAPRGGEMVAVDAGGEGMDVRVARALRLVQAVATGEHHVGRRHQVALEPGELGRGETEIGEFVHAVIDRARRPQMVGEGEHHRRVVPAHQPPGLPGQQSVEERPQRGGPRRALQGIGQDRGHDRDPARTLLDVEPGCAVAAAHRLLPVEDACVPREAGHQVLRTLEHEVPAQVRKADQGGNRFGFVRQSSMHRPGHAVPIVIAQRQSCPRYVERKDMENNPRLSLFRRPFVDLHQPV